MPLNHRHDAGRARTRRAACVVLAIAAALLPVVALADPTYVVRAGDTLSAIAAANLTSVQALVDLNGLDNPDFIRVGQSLRLSADDGSAGATTTPTARATPTAKATTAATPTSSATPTVASGDEECLPTVHVVVAGDTMSGIAARYGVSVAEIATTNGIANPSVISVGQPLQIPGALCREPVALIAPFTDATWSPDLPAQGDTVVLTVRVDGEIGDLAGTFGSAPFSFLAAGDTYTAYIGVPAMAEPGYREVQLTIDGEPAQVLAIPIVAGQFDVERLVLDEETTKLLDPAITQNENSVLAAATSGFTPEILWDGPFAMPLAGNPAVVSAFGTRRAYNDGAVSSYHGGTDFDIAEGTEIYAAAPGRVVLARRLDVRGNAVIIDHGAGVFSMYCHMSRIIATVGDTVDTGDVLGLSGNTGLSTGPHLHWEMRVQGERVDPLRWLAS